MVTAPRTPAATRVSASAQLRIAGISDDLTGAAALASELHAAGLLATVSPWSQPAGVSALAHVVDTASRHLEPALAAARVREAAGGDGLLYKRVDSALRGNVAAELEALGRPLVVACAAPRLGAVTVGGIQQVGDTRVALLDFVPGAALLGLDAVRGTGLDARLASVADHVICDAETDEDLARIAAALASPALRDRVVPVGSYGLARPWAAVLLGAARVPRPPVLCAVSSVKPVSLAQVASAAAQGAHCTYDAARADLEPARRALRAGVDVVLAAGPAPTGGIVAPDPAVAAALAERVVQLAREGHLGGLVLVGGDLASAFLATAGASAMIVAEPWPTAPLVRLRGGPLDGLRAVLKSGTQGPTAWLEHAVGVVCAVSARREEPDAR